MQKELYTRRNFIYTELMLLLFFILIVPKEGFIGDLGYWRSWSWNIYSNGLPAAYRSDTDYLPGYQYLIYLYTLLQKSGTGVLENIHYLKTFTMAFHLFNGYQILKFTREYRPEKDGFAIAMMYIFNFAIIYNGLVWGQVDDIFTCFVFLAFYSATRGRVLPTMIGLLLAINFKLQAIIFLPPLLLMLIPAIRQRLSGINLLKWTMIPLAIQLTLVLPFVLHGDFNRIIDVILHANNRYPLVSANAYNFWNFFLDVNPNLINDSSPFVMSITYKETGLFLFFTFSFIVLLPLLKHVMQPLSQLQKPSFPFEKLILLMGIIPLLFFFLNTEMHERYSHPALIFLFIYGIYTNRYLPFILTSTAYFLNLEDVLHWMGLKNYNTFIFNRDFIASLYAASIALLLYYNFSKREDTIKREVTPFDTGSNPEKQPIESSLSI